MSVQVVIELSSVPTLIEVMDDVMDHMLGG